jgi:hypothetical protein
MNPQESKMVKSMAMSLIAIFAAISLFYTLDLYLIKSQLLLGLIYYFFVMVLFMALIMIVGMIYQLAMMRGKKLPGIYSSIFYKHLTEEQVANLSQTHEGKINIFYHEFILLRLDVMFPASIIFALLFLNAIPQVAVNPINYIAMADLLGIFALSYIVYTQVQANMIAIKLTGSIPQEQIMKIEDVISMVAMEV